MAVSLKEVSGKLIAEVDGKSYILGLGGAAAETAQSIKDMDAVLQHIEKEGAALTEGVKTFLKQESVLADIATHGGSQSKITAIKNALGFKFAGATEAEKVAELINAPVARKFLSAEALEKAGIKDVKTLDGYLTTREELIKAIKAGGDNKAKLEQFFIDNHNAPKEVRTALAAVKVEGVATDLGPIAEAVQKGITADMDALKGFADKAKSVNERHAAQQAKIEKARVDGVTGDALKEIEKGLEPIEAERKAVTEGVDKLKKDNPRFKVAKEALAKEDETIAKLFKEEKAFGGIASDAAKKGWFSKAEAELSSLKPEQLKGIRGLWNKRNFAGKAGIVAGAGAVTYAVVSAIGGKGPGERAEAVNKGREGQTAGASVA